MIMKRISLFSILSGVCVSFLFSCNQNTQSEHPKVDTVIIQSMQFQPAELLVNKFDTVVWINKGLVAHNVTEFPDQKWTSDTIAAGAIWKKAIDSSFEYLCTIHPAMRGKILVKDSNK